MALARGSINTGKLELYDITNRTNIVFLDKVNVTFGKKKKEKKKKQEKKKRKKRKKKKNKKNIFISEFEFDLHQNPRFELFQIRKKKGRKKTKHNKTTQKQSKNNHFMLGSLLSVSPDEQTLVIMGAQPAYTARTQVQN